MPIVAMSGYLSCWLCGLLLSANILPAMAQPLAQQASEHPRPVHRCENADACLHILLQQAGNMDMRSSMEAMHQLLQMHTPRKKIFIASGEWQKRAQQALEEGNLAAGRELLLQALVISPEHPMLHLQLGQILLRQDNWQGAAHSFRQALSRAPWLSEAWDGLAQVSLAQQDTQQASAALLLAYEWSPKKTARKAHYLSQTSKPAYAQALAKMTARNIAVIDAWQHAKLANDVKPQLLQRKDYQCSPPEYPLQAQRLGAEGQVKLEFLMDVDGSVLASHVLTSSGNQELDASAQISLHACFGLHLPTPLKQRLRGSTQFDWRLY